MQEMGFTCDLTFSHKFIYKVHLDNDLIEHEWDYVLIGYFDGVPLINKYEAQAWKFESIDTIQKDIKQNPDLYTCWFKLIIDHPELLSLAR